MKIRIPQPARGWGWWVLAGMLWVAWFGAKEAVAIIRGDYPGTLTGQTRGRLPAVVWLLIWGSSVGGLSWLVMHMLSVPGM